MAIKLPLKRPPGGQRREWLHLYMESLEVFADSMIEMQEGLDFHMSARGWCYVLEQYGLDKGDFNWAQEEIQNARLHGYLKPRFILEDDAHKVSWFDDDETTPEDYVDNQHAIWKTAAAVFEECWKDYSEYEMNFWNGKDCYIQLLVEKVDLKSLFHDICEKYSIPIANMKGWGSMEQKAVMASNFWTNEIEGRKPILFACGDFDPPGLCISKVLMGQFKEYAAFTGWNPENLTIERIGLNKNYIQENKLTWIEGLITGSGKNLADPNHNFYKNNVYNIREYIAEHGERKCEANAIVVIPELGRKILQDAIDKYLGIDAYVNYEKEIDKRKDEAKELVDEMLENEQ